MTKNLLACLVLFVITACLKQPHSALVPPDLDAICRIEKDRHGEQDLNHHFFTFSNAAMDAYVNNPGPPDKVWQRFQQANGVCRGAYLTLLVQAHPDFLADHLKALMAATNQEEQIFLMRCWRQNPDPGLASLVPGLLKSSEKISVRKEAANHFGSWALSSHASETEMLTLLDTQPEEVLQQAIWSLNADDFSDDFWEYLLQYPNADVQETSLLVLNQGQNQRRQLAQNLGRSSQYPKIQDLANELAGQQDALKMKVTISGYPAKDSTAPCLCEAKYRLLEEQFAAYFGSPIEDTDLTKMDPEGEIPLFEVALYGSVSSFIQLLEIQPEWVHATTADGQSVLTTLVQGFYQTQRKNGKPCFEAAMPARYRPKDLVIKLQWLLDHGAAINQRDESGRTALFAAVFGDKSEIIQLLLCHGADPDLRDWEGNSARSVGQLMDQTWME